MLSDFDKGRIEGAMVYWEYYAQNMAVEVPSVDRMLKLPSGTTEKYLNDKEKANGIPLAG